MEAHELSKGQTKEKESSENHVLWDLQLRTTLFTNVDKKAATSYINVSACEPSRAHCFSVFHQNSKRNQINLDMFEEFIVDGVPSSFVWWLSIT